MISIDYVEKTLAYLKDPDVGFVYSSVIIGSSDWIGKLFYRYSSMPVKIISANDYIRKTIFSGNIFPVSPGCGIYRTTDLQESLLDNLPSMKFPDFNNHGGGADLLVLLNIARKHRKVIYIDQPLSFFRVHNQSITIADISGELNDYYNRAKLIFLQSHCSSSCVSVFCVSLWIAEMKKRTKYIPFDKVIEKYDFFCMNICKDIVVAFLSSPLWLFRILVDRLIRYRS